MKWIGWSMLALMGVAYLWAWAKSTGWRDVAMGLVWIAFMSAWVIGAFKLIIESSR